MQLQILALDMRYSFNTKTTQNILKAVLPSGRLLEFEVSEEEVTAMMALDQMEVPFDALHEPGGPPPGYSEPTGGPPRYLDDPADEPAESQDTKDGVPISWADIPDDVLAPWIKAKFQLLGLPDVMDEQDIVLLAKQLIDKAAVRPPVALGVVERNVPLPGRTGDRRQARVDSDERGNPVVEQRADQAPQYGFDDDTGARSV